MTAVHDVRATTDAESSARGSAHGYIPEVQGLRTVALVLVAVFHIWFGGVSGGVDVFLLISAFLLTRSLTKSSEAGNRPRVIRTVLRKFARLLPLAAVTIALTVIAAWLLLPIGVLGSVISDAFASLTYTQNFHLQLLEVDYYALQTSHASLFQQFWSLSIQGQVFVLWPIVHLLGYGVAKLLRLPVRAVLAVMFAMIFAASLTWSVIFTAENQELAYFDTGARIWEFAAGSLLALAMPYVRLGAVWRGILGWVGLAAILSCGFILPVESSFPGYAALWPVAGAAAVILSAGAPTRFGADRVLATGPLRRAGAYTYALYLVHWPILVVFLYLTDMDRADLLGGIFVFGLSSVIAVGITVMVEKPTARWLAHRRRDRADREATGDIVEAPALAVSETVSETASETVSSAASSTVSGGDDVVSVPTLDDERDGLPAVALEAESTGDGPTEAPLAGPADAVSTQDEARHPTKPAGRAGAYLRPIAVIAVFSTLCAAVLVFGQRHFDAVLAEAAESVEVAISSEAAGLLAMGANDPGAEIIDDPIPDLPVAQQDYVVFGEWCSSEWLFGYTAEVCLEQRSVDGAPLFLALGNSHSQQLAALGLELSVITGVPDVRSHALPGCQFELPEADVPATECQNFWQQIPQSYLPSVQPSMVVLMGTLSQPDGSDQIFPDLPEWLTWAQTVSPETVFVVVRDNPRFTFNPLECALDAGWSAPECSVPYLPANLGTYPLDIEAAGAVWIDLNTAICPNYVCRPQVGEVITYFDTNHLTGTFITTLTPAFSRLVAPRVSWWPDDVIMLAQDANTDDVPFTPQRPQPAETTPATP